MDEKPDWRLDVLFGLVLASLAAASLATGFRLGPVEKGLAAVFLTLYIQSWGVLFLVSYLFPNRSYLLKGLTWACEHGRGIRGRWTAVLWGIFAILFGIFPLLRGLGWVRT